MPIFNKILRRLPSIAGNTLRSLSGPGFSVLISLIVINRSSMTVWGEFIKISLVVYAFATLVNWGAKFYLVREFTANPGQWPGLLKINMRSRAVLLIFPMIVLPFIYSDHTIVLISVFWIVMLFGYQSFEAVIIYKKLFWLSFMTECAGFLILLVMTLSLHDSLSGADLAMMFAVSTLMKLCILVIAFRKDVVVLSRTPFDFYELLRTLNFAFQSFSGLLVSKIDLYCVAFFMRPDELGRYQVFISLFMYLQMLPDLIMIPLLRNIYRLDAQALRKFMVRLFGFGMILSLLGTTVIGIALRYGFKIDISLSMLSVGLLFVLPMYGYLPFIHGILNRGRESVVLCISLIGAVLAFGGNVLLIPRFGILGAAIAVSSTQWLIFGFYLIIEYLDLNWFYWQIETPIRMTNSNLP